MIHPIGRTSLMFDAVVAGAIAVVFGLPGLLLLGAAGGVESAYWVAALLVTTAALLIRRIAPAIAILAMLVLACLHIVLGISMVLPIWTGVLIVLYSVGRWGTLIERIIGAVVAVCGAGLVGSFAAGIGGGTLNPGEITASFVVGAVSSLLLFLLMLALGILVDAIVTSQQAARDRTFAAEKASAAAERAAIEEERVAIARDMHDVVAHSLAVVIAQANGARYAREIESKDESLERIASTAKSALGDVRGLLAQLRHSQASDPNAAVSDIPALVDRVRRAGLEVAFHQIGAVGALQKTSDIAAYRIVQEALTNALRHGDRELPVHVRLRWEAARLTVDVHNGVLVKPGAAGHGITGMRERAALAGGTAWAGMDAGWFRVYAAFPLAPTIDPARMTS